MSCSLSDTTFSSVLEIRGGGNFSTMQASYFTPIGGNETKKK